MKIEVYLTSLHKQTKIKKQRKEEKNKEKERGQEGGRELPRVVKGATLTGPL